MTTADDLKPDVPQKSPSLVRRTWDDVKGAMFFIIGAIIVIVAVFASFVVSVITVIPLVKPFGTAIGLSATLGTIVALCFVWWFIFAMIVRYLKDIGKWDEIARNL